MVVERSTYSIIGATVFVLVFFFWGGGGGGRGRICWEKRYKRYTIIVDVSKGNTVTLTGASFFAFFWGGGGGANLFGEKV